MSSSSCFGECLHNLGPATKGTFPSVRLGAMAIACNLGSGLGCMILFSRGGSWAASVGSDDSTYFRGSESCI